MPEVWNIGSVGAFTLHDEVGLDSVSSVAYWILKVILTPVFYVIFRVRIANGSSVPRRGPVILAANHQSFCDSLFIPLCVARRVTFLAKAEYFDDPKQAWFYRGVGQIPIRRGGGAESERALETAAEVLDRRRIVAMYPEGTRSLDEFVHRGRTGIARLALETRVPVIPIGLRGTTAVQPVGSKMLRPFRRLEVHFGDPMYLTEADLIAADGDEKVALRTFTDALMEQITKLSNRPYVDRYVGVNDPEAV